MPFDKFMELIGLLASNGTKQLLIANEDELNALPVNKWFDKLTTLQKASLICDVSSA